MIPTSPSPSPSERHYGPVTTWHPEVEEYLRGCLGEHRLQEINKALCRPSIVTSIRVNTLQGSPEEILDQLTLVLKPQLDAGLCSTPYLHPQIPYVILLPCTGPHVIDYSAAFDVEAGQVREVAVTRICGEAVLRGADVFVPGLQAASKGIEEGQIVAVSIAKEAPPDCKRPLLRGSVLYSASDPMVLQGDTDEERRASASHASALDRTPLHLGLGIAQMSRTRMFKEAKGVAVKMVKRVFELPSMEAVLPGRIMLQNLPSIVAAHVLDPKPGSRVLDMCASPGGKTTALAQLMHDQGEIIALDRSNSKVADIVHLCKQLGVTCVKTYKMDASWACRKTTASSTQASGAKAAAKGGAAAGGGQALSAREQARQERRRAAALQRGMPDPLSLAAAKAEVTDGFDAESFDYVLLDAPCSALGIRPRLTQTATLQELERTAQYQRGLIDTAVRLLRVGGSMVFSTCTISPMENEANVRYLLDKYPQMHLVQQTPRLGGKGLVGRYPRRAAAAATGGAPGRGVSEHLALESEIGNHRTVTVGRTQAQGPSHDAVAASAAAGPFDVWLTEEEAARVQRFDPGQGEWTGFFVAKFEKLASIGGAASADREGISDPGFGGG